MSLQLSDQEKETIRQIARRHVPATWQFLNSWGIFKADAHGIERLVLTGIRSEGFHGTYESESVAKRYRTTWLREHLFRTPWARDISDGNASEKELRVFGHAILVNDTPERSSWSLHKKSDFSLELFNEIQEMFPVRRIAREDILLMAQEQEDGTPDEDED